MQTRGAGKRRAEGEGRGEQDYRTGWSRGNHEHFNPWYWLKSEGYTSSQCRKSHPSPPLPTTSASVDKPNTPLPHLHTRPPSPRWEFPVPRGPAPLHAQEDRRGDLPSPQTLRLPDLRAQLLTRIPPAPVCLRRRPGPSREHVPPLPGRSNKVPELWEPERPSVARSCPRGKRIPALQARLRDCVLRRDQVCLLSGNCNHGNLEVAQVLTPDYIKIWQTKSENGHLLSSEPNGMPEGDEWRYDARVALTMDLLLNLSHASFDPAPLLAEFYKIDVKMVRYGLTEYETHDIILRLGAEVLHREGFVGSHVEEYNATIECGAETLEELLAQARGES
ncbi:hypothetical protein BDK51DRAFT_41273 [Blyttiomyces helicus]|uniref:Uncharacterized protein n=1 Tax=Blyttiomyces helicus TaxID=388810 RepID=A0A4V1IRP2_9FUNG|nr:hypothetical protein BDK51DRAFT_41273 [Blyttiomyces helicus]|eukprot:RKO90747.1 hypothetical protein BDK51DRAFT_41273 [Blyttiomyces helicus]